MEEGEVEGLGEEGCREKGEEEGHSEGGCREVEEDTVRGAAGRRERRRAIVREAEPRTAFAPESPFSWGAVKAFDTGIPIACSGLRLQSPCCFLLLSLRPWLQPGALHQLGPV